MDQLVSVHKINALDEPSISDKHLELFDMRALQTPLIRLVQVECACKVGLMNDSYDNALWKIEKSQRLTERMEELHNKQ